jgi:cyclopropane-fatty-acyl-phospholipid synthase
MVGERRARVWRLYMALSARGFERGSIAVHQVLAVRPHVDGADGLPLRPTW